MVSRVKAMNLFACPVAHGQTKAGVEKGAIFLRDSLSYLFDKTVTLIPEQKNRPSSDAADIEGIQQQRFEETVQYNKRLFGGLQDTNKEDFNVIFGGDHSISAASVLAHKNRFPGERVGVLWIDAHADINTVETSPSKSTHGMPLAFGTKMINFSDDANLEYLKYDELVYYGLRSVDDEERNLIQAQNIKNFKFPSDDFFACLNEFDRLHVSFDIDVLDPSIIQCTGCLVEEGEEISTISNIVAKLDNVTSLDIVEFNPTINPERSASNLNIITKMFSSFARRQGSTPPQEDGRDIGDFEGLEPVL